MARIFEYTGTVDSFRFDPKGCGCTDMVLSDDTDWDTAPVRLAAYGALARYIRDRSWTDAEERYINARWYYDANLTLSRIEIPTADGTGIAKVITQDDTISPDLRVFGPQEYLDAPAPAPLSEEQLMAWCAYQQRRR